MLRLSRRLREDDRGGVAVIVAALLGGGVLLGMLALVIDVGRLLEERRELQNGVDAAAASLAQACARKSPDCSAVSGPSVADAIADANAKDGLSTLDSFCGFGAALAPCAPPGSSVYDCGPLPAAGTAFVEVRSRTQSSDGGAVRSLFTAQDTTLRACGRAAWGAPARSSGVSFTMSLCEWRAATTNGTVYAPGPPYPPNPAITFERNILLHHTLDGVTTCPAGPSGADLPGGFGWLEDSNATCLTAVDVNGNYADQTGNATRQPCRDAVAAARTSRQPLFVPVYDSVSGTGSEGVYHAAGFAAFVVTGYSLSGLREKSWLTGAFPCSGDQRCISGFFTKALIPANGPLAPVSADFGAQIVRPIS